MSIGQRRSGEILSENKPAEERVLQQVFLLNKRFPSRILLIVPSQYIIIINIKNES